MPGFTGEQVSTLRPVGSACQHGAFSASSARYALRAPLVSLASDTEETICSKKQFMKERLVVENYQRTATKKLKARRSRSVLTSGGVSRSVLTS